MLCTKVPKRYIEILFNKERIKQKFLNKILEDIKKNNIQFEVYDCCEELNKNRSNPKVNYQSIDDLAIGVFGYNLSEDGQVINPKIKIALEGNNLEDRVWIVAHELGHYYRIKYFNDISELGADNYIYKLALRFLNEIEIKIIEISLKIHSGLDSKIEHYLSLKPETYSKILKVYNKKKWKKFYFKLKNYGRRFNI